MAYTLQPRTPSDFDLILDGESVGSVARITSFCGMIEGWLVNLRDGGGSLPAPFHQGSHEFRTLDAASRWLGIASAGEAG